MRFVHCGRQEFIKRIEKQKLVLIGASVQPHEAEKNLQENFDIELSEKIELVIDNDEKKQGKEFQIGERRFLVQSSDVLKTLDWGNRSILITSRFYLVIIEQLKKMEELRDVDVYAWACMILDKELTFQGKLDARIYGEAMLQYQFWLDATSNPPDRKTQLYEQMKLKITEEGYRVLPRVVLMHSNICTRSCEHCCDLIPQVKQPYYIPAKKIIEDLELLLSGVDTCMSVDLTDGEGLLYRDLDTLLDYVLKADKVETVLLISNGTMIPKKSTLELMKHPKFWMGISDYKIGKQFEETCKALDASQIQYIVMRDLIWKDFGVTHIEKRRETRDFLRYEFLRCRNKLCSKAYINRRLYACMPAFRMANIGVYESPRDSVELKEEDSPDEIWKKLYDTCMIDYIDACDYCNFENTGVTFIPVGS